MALESAYSIEIPMEDYEKLDTVGNVISYLADKGVE